MRPLGKAFEQAKAFGETEKLPPGAYALRILAVRYEEATAPDKSDVIIVRYDIDEGEYKGYYARNFDNQQSENPKWKGTYRIYVPVENPVEEREVWTMSKVSLPSSACISPLKGNQFSSIKLI